jgi:hypothetical protein
MAPPKQAAQYCGQEKGHDPVGSGILRSYCFRENDKKIIKRAGL